MPLPDHEQVPPSLLNRSSQDELPTADSLFGDSGPFLSQSNTGQSSMAIANLPARPVRPPSQPAAHQAQFRPVRPVRPMRPPTYPQHLPTQRPQPMLTRPMLPLQNLTRPPRPHDQPRPYHQQQPQQSPQQPTIQLSPQLSYQSRPRPQSPQMHTRPFSPQLHPRPPPAQRPPPPHHTFSPRPTAQNIHSPPKHRPEATHTTHTAPTVPIEPTGTTVSTTPTALAAEKSQQPSRSSFKTAQGVQGIHDPQPTPPKVKDNDHDTSNLFAAVPASSSDKDGLPSADILFGTGSSLDFFRHPPVPIKYAPIQRPSIDDHPPTEMSSTTVQQDVDSLFSPPVTAAATATVMIQHQRSQSEKRSLNAQVVTKIIPLQPPSTEPFQPRDIQESQQSRAAHTFVSTTATTEATDATATQKAVSSATVQGASTHDALLPTYPINNNDASGSDIVHSTAATKHKDAVNHQDSSSLFNESDDTDASHFFSGPSVMDSSAFFVGLSRPGPSALLPGHISITPFTAKNDVSKAFDLPVTAPVTDIRHSTEPTNASDSEPTPTSYAPIPLSAAALATDAANLFGHTSQQEFSSNFMTSLPKQDSSMPTAMVEVSAGGSRPSFDNSEQWTTEHAIVTSDIQRVHGSQTTVPGSTDTPHDPNPVSNPHTYPVSLRESHRPPNSFKDALSSQRHETSQASTPVEHNLEHNPEHIRPMYDAYRMESSSQQAFGGGGHQLDSHQHGYVGQVSLPLESNGLTQQDQGQVSEPLEETETPRPQGRQHEDDHQSPFASFQQPSNAFSSITQESQGRQKSVSDLFNQQTQPSTRSTITPEYRQESVSDLFNQPSQPFALDTHELLDRRESVEDFFAQAAAQQRRVEPQEPLIRKESVSYLPNQAPQSQSFDVQELAEYTQQVSEPFTQMPLSFAFSTQEYKDHRGLPSATMQGVLQPLPFDYPESVPLEPLESSSTQEGSPFETVGFQLHDPPIVSSWQPQEPTQDIGAAQSLDSQKGLPTTQPATFSFNSQFEDIGNSFTIPKHQPKNVNESVSQQAQPTIPLPDLPDQSIPFDETLPSPTSPGFGRNTMGSFAAHDIHGAGAIVQPGSYSIMELSSELAHTAYFAQARESPRLQERVSWSKVASDQGASDLSQGMSPKLEVETLAFDQVSLAEDAPGTNHSTTAITTSTSPPTKERGLASLLDPSTLSAVEDLLNMPKSAAFERGMSRLFKGVKSSATSMFSSPLGQSQSNSLEALGSASATQGQPQELLGTASSVASDTAAVPTTSDLNVSVQPATAPPPPSNSTPPPPPPAAASHPPPPRRNQEKEQFKLAPPPRISHWPAAPDTTTTAIAPPKISPSSKFDWAHKQENVFLESAENAASDPKDEAETLSHIVPELPHEHVSEALTALTFQAATLPTPTKAEDLRNTTVEPIVFDHQLQPRFQEDFAQHLPVIQGHGTPDSSVMPTAHVSDGLLEQRVTESWASNVVDSDEPINGAHKESETSKALETELELSSPNVPHHSVAPHHAADSVLYHHDSSHALDRHTRDLMPHQYAASATLQHTPASPTLLQRAISPSVLDPEVLLRKQAAIHALLADQVALGGSAGAVRTKPDKKERLLEKARELLEKRQQSSGFHLQGNNGGQTGPATHKYTSVGSRSSSEWTRQEESPQRGSVLSRDQFPSPTISPPWPAQQHEPRIDSAVAPYTEAVPTFVAQRQHQHHEQQQRQQETLYNNSDHHLSSENERLKEQIRLLLAETTGLRFQVESQASLQSQVSKLQEDLARIRAESQETEATHHGIRMGHSQQMDDMALENQRLQAALTRVQSEHHHAGAGLNDLMAKCRQLEMELDHSRQVCKEQDTALAEAQRMKEVGLENERLRRELDQSQRELQEQRANVTLERAVSRTSMGLDGVAHTTDQLSQETEGLRRQLKGQRQEMKELQDSVKRSDAEKRDLFSRIGQLERALADAEMHRNEQKSHQAMKDEAYKVIQERLVMSFEEEKAQYLDEEAFKTAKLEHRCSLLQDEVATLRARDDGKSLSAAEEEELRNRMTQLELDLEAARMSESELRIKAEESIGSLENMKRNESNMAVALATTEDRARALQEELIRVRVEASSGSTAADDAEMKHATALGSLSEELQLSLERERVLTRELELISETMKEGFVSGTHTGRSDRDDLELSRLSENASTWQEECLAAKEETMRVEDQLQRANLELMAARTEILQLEANLAVDESSSASTAELHCELAELRERVAVLSSEIQGRDIVLDDFRASRQHERDENSILQEDRVLHSEKYSVLERQLEQQRGESVQLEKELLESRELLREAQTTIAASVGPSQRIEELEGQCEKMKGMMLEKQTEVEQLMIELDSTVCKLSGMERELDLVKAQKTEEQSQRAALEDSLSQSIEQRNEEAARRELFVEQSVARQEALNQQISILEESRSVLEASLREHVTLAEASKQEASSLQSLVEKLGQDLATASVKNSAQKDDELVGERESVLALRSEMSAKEVEFERAKEQVLLIVDLFGKLLSPLEDAEELVMREGMMTLLEGLELLGVSVQALPQAGVRYLGLQKEIRETKAHAEDLESQLDAFKLRQQQVAPTAVVEAKGDVEMSVEKSEVDRLRQELEKAEHGIGKLQQFLQEFQNEKKRAIYELQQRLEESEEEVAHARSQLAKAQALMLSRHSGSVPVTTTQSPDMPQPAWDRMGSRKSSMSIDRERDQGILRDETFKGTEAIHREAVLALEPLRLQKAELERTLLDLRHRYELSQKENDALLSGLERENKVLKSKVDMRSPDMSNEHLERIRELELEQVELNRQLKTAQREREFTRQDMRSLKAELSKLRTR